MEYSENNQRLHCGECGKNYDPLSRPGFLRFLAFTLITNLIVLVVIMIHFIYLLIEFEK